MSELKSSSTLSCSAAEFVNYVMEDSKCSTMLSQSLSNDSMLYSNVQDPLKPCESINVIFKEEYILTFCEPKKSSISSYPVGELEDDGTTETSKCSIFSMPISIQSTVVDESLETPYEYGDTCKSSSSRNVIYKLDVLKSSKCEELKQAQERKEEMVNKKLTIVSEVSGADLDPQHPVSTKAVKYDNETLRLICHWGDCSYETKYLIDFTSHVVYHTSSPKYEWFPKVDKPPVVLLVCKWDGCMKRVKFSNELLRHAYLHVYHTKLKSLGENTIKRVSDSLDCQGDRSAVNIVPDISHDFTCGWTRCSKSFINVQEFYDHVRYHCIGYPKGKTIIGGINCQWKDCDGTYPNVTKLRDHVKTHTQEKLNACPTCGNLFSNRTRLLDHCHRRVASGEVTQACDFCSKQFSSARLLRDHVRSHINTYRCPECDMSCVSPSALNSHVKYRHSQESPFTCRHCTYAAKTTSDLIRHERVHESTIYECESEGCEFKARSAQTLKMHTIRKHNDGETARYLCHVCDSRYVRGYSLTQHLIKKHNLQWPAGHIRFRYKIQEDGCYRLLTVRYESEEHVTDPLESDVVNSTDTENR